MSEQEKSGPQAEIQQLIDAIEMNLTVGFLYCRVAKHFRKAFEDQKLVSSNPFDLGIFLACRDGAILAVNRIADKGSQPASLRNLLKQNPESYCDPTQVGQEEKIRQIAQSAIEHEQYLCNNEMLKRSRDCEIRLWRIQTWLL